MPPLDERETALRGHERGPAVAEAVLVELRRLDGGDDRGPTGARGEGRPGGRRFRMPSHPSEQVGPVDGDPFGGPRRIELRAPDRQDARQPPRTAPVVGRSTWRPPRFVARRDPRWGPERLRRCRVDGHLGRRVEAGQRFGEASLPGEGTGEPGQVARRGRRIGSRDRPAVSRGARAARRGTGRPGRCGERRQPTGRPPRRAGTRGSGPGSPNRRRPRHGGARAARPPRSAAGRRPCDAGTIGGRSGAGRGARRGLARSVRRGGSARRGGASRRRVRCR